MLLGTMYGSQNPCMSTGKHRVLKDRMDPVWAPKHDLYGWLHGMTTPTRSRGGNANGCWKTEKL